jgi:hypothetical protein
VPVPACVGVSEQLPVAEVPPPLERAALQLPPRELVMLTDPVGATEPDNAFTETPTVIG